MRQQLHLPTFMLVMFLLGSPLLPLPAGLTIPTNWSAPEQLELKMAPDLFQLVNTRGNPEIPVDILAGIQKDADWRDVQRTILRGSPLTQIKAYHRLIHAISLHTTVAELEGITGIPEIYKVWTDISIQLDNPQPTSMSRKNAPPPTEYVRPQTIIDTLPLAQLGLNGSHTIVALLDTGIDSSHPDLDDLDDNETTDDPKVLGQVSFVEGDPFPFDLNGHGTYCAGLIAGTGYASEGLYAGIAPQAQLLSAKVLLADGTGYSSWVIRGIEWSITAGADIIVLPFSTLGLPGDPLSQAVEAATEQGVLIVTAAGDRGPNHMTIMSPGESLAALTVGAYDSQKRVVAEFSSRGPTFDMRSKPDIIAPGTDIVSCSLYNILPQELGANGIPLSPEDLDFFGITGFGDPVNENYTMASTTAAAAAITSGVACLLLEGCRFATPVSLILGMRQGAMPLQGEPNVEGAGLVNASAALQELQILYNPIPADFRGRSVTPSLPYFGVLMSQTDEENVSLLLSSYTTAMTAIVLSNITNMTMMHMLMGMFYLAVNDSSPIPFAFLDIEQEFHWTTLPLGTYVRATGILAYGDLLIIPRIESWQIVEAPSANAFRFTFYFVNIGEKPVEDIQLFSLWNFGLFFGANDTSAQLGTFNSSTQLFHITADVLPPNETTRVEQHIGINATIPLTHSQVGPYNDVSANLQNKTLNGNPSYLDDDEIGFGSEWNLGTLTTQSPTRNLTFVLGFGHSKAALLHGINKTTNATLLTPLADLCMIRVALPRTGSTHSTYLTKTTVLNIGDATVDGIAAFFTNRSQPQGGALFVRYFQLENMDPFGFTSLTVEWNPELIDIYLAAWIVSPEITLDLFSLTAIDDHYLLDNFIFRDVFVCIPHRYRTIIPGQLPYGPMMLRFPNDYALYNLTILSSTTIEHLEINVAGTAAEWVNITPSEINDISLGTQFQLMILIPTFLESGFYSADITVSCSDGWTRIVPLVVNVTYPKAVILFDTAHNQGFDFTGLGESNFAELDLDFLMEAFAELSDSLLTGYSRLRELFAEADLNLTEIPFIEEVNASLLALFDGLILCDPETGFTPTELTNITQFINSGFRVWVIADNPEATNHTALNQLLGTQGIQLDGFIAASNTTDLHLTSPFTQDLSVLTTEEGTYIQSLGASQPFAWENRSPVGSYLGDDHRELFIFGCSAPFGNEYIVQVDNLRFTNQTIQYLFRKTVEITIAPTGGNGTIFTLGNDAGFVIDATNQTGHGVEGLTMYVVYQLANGSDFLFIAFEVKEGRYGTFLFANWTGGVEGTYTIIVFTIPGNYSSTSAFMHFHYIPAPLKPDPPPDPDFVGLMNLQITLAIVGTISLLLGYVLAQYRRRRRMLTPTIDEQLIERIDNALNTTQALIRELEWTLTDRRMDRLEKLRFASGKTSDRLDQMLRTLRELAKETGT